MARLCCTCWSYKALKLSCSVSSTAADAPGCFGRTQPQSGPLQVKDLRSESGPASGAAGGLPHGQVPSRLQEGKSGADPGLFCESCHHQVCGDPGPFAQREHPTAAGTGSTVANTPGAGLGRGLGLSGLGANLCNALEELRLPRRVSNGGSAPLQSCRPSEQAATRRVCQ